LFLFCKRGHPPDSIGIIEFVAFLFSCGKLSALGKWAGHAAQLTTPPALIRSARLPAVHGRPNLRADSATPRAPNDISKYPRRRRRAYRPARPDDWHLRAGRLDS